MALQNRQKAISWAPRIRRGLQCWIAAALLGLSSHAAVAQEPLQRGAFSFTIDTSDPTPGDGLCETPDPNDQTCAHILTGVTVAGTTYTTLTLPSSFSASGFPIGANVQSRIHNTIGDYVFGDPGYDANMLANVFSNADLNIYQQVDSNATAGTFVVEYPTLFPSTSERFLLITERLGNNTLFVEAFDTTGASMGLVEISRISNDYTPSDVRVGANQLANVALIPLDRFLDPANPSRLIESFEITNRSGNDGGDFKAFIIGAPVLPFAENDSDLDNALGPVTVDVLANDQTAGVFIPGTLTLTGTAGPGLPLTVPGQGVWSVDTGTGAITFTPDADFGDDPTPITYRVSDNTPSQTNAATVTITYVIEPEITLVKTITDVDDTNGSGVIGDAGDTITYAFTVTNTGNVSLGAIAISDLMLSPTPLSPPQTSLAPGTSTTLTGLTYVIQPVNELSGLVFNSATVTGAPVATTPGGAADPGTPLRDIAGNPLAAVNDTSDTGSEADINGGTPVTIATPGSTDSDGAPGNDGDEPTILVLPPPGLSPGITLVKSVTDVDDSNGSGLLGDAGDTITYAFTVTNSGNTALADIFITDGMLNTTPLLPPDTVLAAGASTTLTGQTYVIQPGDVTAGEVDNSATATGSPIGTDLNGAPLPTLPLSLPDVTDTSDTGTEPAINGGTPLTIGDPAATDSDGTAGNDGDEPTVLALPTPGPELTLVKLITNVADTDASGTTGDLGDVITYAFTITNTGDTSLTDVSITDTMLSATPLIPPLVNLAPGESTTLTGQTYVIDPDDVAMAEVENSASATGTPVATVAGAPDPTTPLGLADVTDISDTGTEPLNAGSTPVTIPNPGATDSDGTAGNDGDEPTILFLLAGGVSTLPPPPPAPGIEITKTTPEDIIERGQIVPYTIQLINTTGAAFGPVDIIDELPEGFVYIPGTAQLDGVDVAVTVTPTTVTVSGVASPAGSTRVVTLSLRALTGSGPGTYVNEVIALDPILGLGAGPATASVRILPEAVFDCATVIGRVFDDVDGDGYQDSFAPGVNPPEISDQSYDGDKPDTAPADDIAEERGLPGVRLIALDGTRITTDANGLFSVPCAALPADRGTNFLLSLDERTLPLGYEMTTENPRVMRLTPGMITEMNFGAQLADLIRVDLSAAAFGPGGSLDADLRAGIGSLVAYLQAEPASVGLIYHVPADAQASTVAAGRASMDRVEAELRHQWAEVSRTRLVISQTIAREGQ